MSAAARILQDQRPVESPPEKLLGWDISIHNPNWIEVWVAADEAEALDLERVLGERKKMH